ncbi:MAG: VTT domain-containing protein [Proteobacteria bacterium]|uniref:TVP38/TMEM64 family membrane protein n=1 Tax=Pseudodesulfovibrio aespoeensis (strain ATCC 700646 / DSM 10631 / Aspo-2) TaxID=643562 RepID=E6VQW6_PSEA9|nr:MULTISPECIES: VTT domain-containing protein [Pseudodesulfovibrio]MBU4191429.1 VTT domain-containing protein [Pseudomonadota bacterium]ADU62946.1 SNARE associated Golgi protein-like protein [Pseudodesulfovibrio aespoeensis Aspo-2]MBU4243370.1 VTT domain-containing protein [Pseudomonadota bacterium]MBU4378361.1 VTT domain-containing protein [Pseudomonadota bacterium]MBU4514668.1 VTT domain-containing protein [Pseudomonadota bacterium]
MEHGHNGGVWRTILKVGAVLAVLGAVSWAMEHWGGGGMTLLSAFVAAQGSLAGAVFVTINAVAVMLLVPQSLFTVAAGAMFGWKLGGLLASIGMTIGALGAFLAARHGLRRVIVRRYGEHPVFRAMQRLSVSHPLRVLALSRLIPVMPFPATSYLLGIVSVRPLPFVFLTWLCMLPETLLLASGGHLLHSGITGRASVEAAVALLAAGVVLAVVVHRMKRRIVEAEKGD